MLKIMLIDSRKIPDIHLIINAKYRATVGIYALKCAILVSMCKFCDNLKIKVF